MSSFQILSRTVGSGHPCFIIAEIAQAHDGSLGLAHKHIEVAARCGVDAVKFQTHIADAESTPEEPWRVAFSRQDKTRFDYWRRMEFTPEQWAGLKEHAEEEGLIFLSSPFSEAAVDLLERLGTPAWKVASGEVDNEILLRHLLRSKRPLLISSGMSDPAELDRCVQLCREGSVPVGIFQCTTAYPCPAARIGLEWVRQLALRYQAPSGLSDHSGEIYASLAAVALGASMIEVHLALSDDMFGPDVKASLLPRQLEELCRGIRFIETSLACPVDKSARSEEQERLRTTFGKSVHVARSIAAGEQIAWWHLTAKKPGDGIPARDAYKLVGSVACRDLPVGSRLTPADVRSDPPVRQVA